jgi:short-subunit dehydrogenase
MYNPFSLSRKTILVTGASSGIGKATAIECSKLGASVIITGRNRERLNETFSELENEGHNQVIADLCETSSLQNLVTGIEHIDGTVQVLPKIYLFSLLLQINCRK